MSTELPPPVVETPPETPLEQARGALIRTGRSQQMALPNLVTLLELLDWAIETNWTPPTPPIKAKDAEGKEVQPDIRDYKMTSEGFPEYVPPPGVTVEKAPEKSKKTMEAANGPVTESETGKHRRHRGE